MKVIVTIAGSDSGGGAGIQADLRAISANGGFGASVLTAVTAQNTSAVTMAEEMSQALIEAQCDAVFEDLPVDAVKTGMLSSEAVVSTVAAALRKYTPPFYVMDPVMVSKSGYNLLEEGATSALCRDLFPLATVVTPNVHEAEAMAGRKVRTFEDAEWAGRRLLEYGPQAVLIKGGHLLAERATDILVTDDGSEALRGEWIDTKNTHGTGCTYSAAIATQLARGRPLLDAVRMAKEYVTEAIRGGISIGSGAGPTDHFFYLRRDDSAAWEQRLRVVESRDE